jgi:hypothetical protein
MSNKALAYAEDKLGVHTTYEQAVQAKEDLDRLLSDLDKAHDRKRGLQGAIEDRTFDLLTEERGKHADQSATWLDQHMKGVRNKDDAMRKYRAALDEVSSEIQGLEYDAEILKFHIKISVARLEELGGYLHYLAAVKEAETTTKSTSPTTPSKDAP